MTRGFARNGGSGFVRNGGFAKNGSEGYAGNGFSGFARKNGFGRTRCWCFLCWTTEGKKMHGQGMPSPFRRRAQRPAARALGQTIQQLLAPGHLPAPEWCQPASTTLPHEGLPQIADAFTRDSTKQALTNQALPPPPEPKSGFIRGWTRRQTVNHVHGKYT